MPGVGAGEGEAPAEEARGVPCADGLGGLGFAPPARRRLSRRTRAATMRARGGGPAEWLACEDGH